MSELDSSPSSELNRVREVDLTHEGLYGLQARLTAFVKDGFLLHGSRQSDAVVLEPRESRDAFAHKDTAMAVFATDRPLIALARGAAGSRLQIWTALSFGVDKLEKPFQKEGYVYVVPGDGFHHDLQDPAEYLSAQLVKPAFRVKFKTETVAPIFRETREVDELVDPERRVMRPELARQADIDVALLEIGNLLTLTGDVFYLERENAEWFERLGRLSEKLEPILSRLDTLATSVQKQRAKEIYQLFNSQTYEIFNVPFRFATMAEAAYRQMVPILEKLKGEMKT